MTKKDGLSSAQDVMSFIGNPVIFILCLGLILSFQLIFLVVDLGIYPAIFFYLGLCLGTLIVAYHAPNRFAGFFWQRTRPVSEMDNETRRVLTFFKSREQTILSIIVHTGLTIAIFIGLVMLRYFRMLEVQTTDGAFSLLLSFFMLFLAGLLGGAFQMCFTYGYPLYRWNHIQKKYPPWPVDKPYISGFKLWLLDRFPTLKKKRKPIKFLGIELPLWILGVVIIGIYMARPDLEIRWGTLIIIAVVMFFLSKL